MSIFRLCLVLCIIYNRTKYQFVFKSFYRKANNGVTHVKQFFQCDNKLLFGERKFEKIIT